MKAFVRRAYVKYMDNQLGLLCLACIREASFLAQIPAISSDEEQTGSASTSMEEFVKVTHAQSPLPLPLLPAYAFIRAEA